MPAPPLWRAWRRRRGSREPWQPSDIPAGTKGEVYQAVCERELRGADEMVWEYQVMPEGQQPQMWQTFSKRLGNGRRR